MDKDLEITTSLDQTIIVEDQDILYEVELSISNALSSKDIDLAFDFCKRMIGQMKKSGIALAKALWMINKAWSSFKIGDNFLHAAQDALGLHPHTIERYVKVWDMLMYHVPAELKDTIQQKNIKSLVPIANALAQGFEIEDGTWKDLANATDFNEISRIVREDVKEASPRKNNLTLGIDNVGSIWAYNGGERYFVGSLEIKDDNDIVKKSVERIISNAGMLRG